MLSRVADALYWLGRYLERSENLARLLLVTEDFSTETQALTEDAAAGAWKDLLAVFPGAALTRPTPAEAPLPVPYLVGFFVDAGNPYSILHALRKARENARAVREALSVETFVAVNERYRALEAYDREGRLDLPSLRDAISLTHRGLFGIVGAMEATLSRDEAWHFLHLGRALERLYRTALVLRVKLPPLVAPGAPGDVSLQATRWRALLRGLSSLENYRQAAGARMDTALVVPFLLFDPHAPRALRYGVGAVKACLDHLAGGGPLTPAGRLVGRLLADLEYDAERLVADGDVEALLDRVVTQVSAAHDALAAQYFVT
jgi:uncharacterized alpha-E superfamily protein